MSDDVPTPQSEAPVSNQSQPHPSDRKSITTDTERQQLEQSQLEQSQEHRSDRQATAPDTGHQTEGGGNAELWEIHFGVKTPKEQEIRDALDHR